MAPTQSAVRSRALRIAVAGNPNSGKTTLFNALSGLRHRVANYPGVTVEKREGRFQHQGRSLTLVDLPGTYSLSVRAPDERIARDVLLGALGESPPDGVLIVVDASNLDRNLYLVSQILDLGLPAVIACNMMDIVEGRGEKLDLALLSRELGVPVVGTVGSSGRGVTALRNALAVMSDRTSQRPWRLPTTLESAVSSLAGAMRESTALTAAAAEGAALLMLTDAPGPVASAGTLSVPSATVLRELDAQRTRLAREGIDDVSGTLIEARYAWIEQLVGRVRHRGAPPAAPGASLSDQIDRVVTHRVFGVVIFAAVMLLMFVAIFSWAEPLMNGIDRGQHLIANGIRTGLPAGPLTDLLADGVIGGVGAVVVFFPQICILFLFIAILEDSGYMARAAFLMDRPMRAAGLHGKSFVPLLSSYACAVPGIMATRTVEDPRDRLATILVAPLMSCSARLPVYLTIIAAVFAGSVWTKVGIIAAMYLIGTLTALIGAAIFKRTLLRGPAPTFILELPPYHLPRPWTIVRLMWDRSKQFLVRAGTTIAAVCIVLWALAYLPRDVAGTQRAEQRRHALLADAGRASGPRSSIAAQAALREIENERAGSQLRQSWLGRMGRTIEPALRPLGFDWRLGVGVLASFAAREVFVSTMGVVFNMDAHDADAGRLDKRLRAARWESGPQAGRALMTPLAGLSLMIFYVYCCQCVSTLAVVRRETNSWRWPAFMFGYMTALAYLASLLVYQVGSRLPFMS